MRYFFVTSTVNLGDFLNVMPVLSGLSKQIGKYELVIQQGMSKFNGMKEFLLYQDLFTNVHFSNEVDFNGTEVIEISCFGSEQRQSQTRPIETCRYANFLKERYGIDVIVDDDFLIKHPFYDITIEDCYYVGDRWSHITTDNRRKSNLFSDLSNIKHLDYSSPILENCYIINNLKKPLITSFTGVAGLADLLNVKCYIVWKADFFNEEYQHGENVIWANGKDMQGCFDHHFYADRKAKLIHYNELLEIIKES